MKRCYHCKTELPLECFGKKGEGLRSECIECGKKISRAYYAANQERLAAAAKEAARTWRAAPGNAQRNRDAAAKWAEQNRETARSRARAWDVANAARKAANDTAYRKVHKAQRNALVKAYKQRKRNAMPSWANEFFISEAYHLAEVRTKVTGFPWHVDHVVPLQGETVCGLHVEHNLAVIPKKHNLFKGNRYWPDMP